MIDNYQAYLEQPTLDHFLQLQHEVTQEEDFDPRGVIVYQLQELCEAGNYQKLYQVTAEIPFAWVTSPSVHLYATIAAEKLGYYSEAETESFLVHSMLEGILLTGQGTAESPYKITQQSDIWDVLSLESRQSVRQRLLGSANGPIEEITCDNGEQLFFDLSLVMQHSGQFTSSQINGRLKSLPQPSSKARLRLSRERLNLK